LARLSLLALPELLDATEAVRQGAESALSMELLECLQQNRHPDRLSPQSSAQIGLGTPLMA
jgi:hypothetical protein